MAVTQGTKWIGITAQDEGLEKDICVQTVIFRNTSGLAANASVADYLPGTSAFAAASLPANSTVVCTYPLGLWVHGVYTLELGAGVQVTVVYR